MMRKKLATRLARKTHQSQAKVADQVDSIVTQLLRKLRRGQPADLPGLGTLLPEGRGVRFEVERPTGATTNRGGTANES